MLSVFITSTESKLSSSSTLQLLPCWLLCKTPFSSYVCMRTRCLVLRTQIAALGLRTKQRTRFQSQLRPEGAIDKFLCKTLQLDHARSDFSVFCFTIELHVHDVQALLAYQPSCPCLHEKFTPSFKSAWAIKVRWIYACHVSNKRMGSLLLNCQYCFMLAISLASQTSQL